jgi:hypothetical protein
MLLKTHVRAGNGGGKGLPAPPRVNYGAVGQQMGGAGNRGKIKLSGQCLAQLQSDIQQCSGQNVPVPVLNSLIGQGFVQKPT